MKNCLEDAIRAIDHISFLIQSRRGVDGPTGLYPSLGRQKKIVKHSNYFFYSNAGRKREELDKLGKTNPESSGK